MSQLDLFGSAQVGRDEALARVEENAEPEWKEVALAAVRATCEQLPEFIVDDVWRVGRLPSTREDRALGPVMLRAARAGWCEKTGRLRPSVRSHLSGKPEWRSLIFSGRAVRPGL